MSWAGAKVAIIDALDGLSITSPSAKIQRVYPNPPGTIQDKPSFIIYPPTLDITLGSQLRQRVYRPKLRLIVSDQDLGQAAAIADAFREVLVTAFDNKTHLVTSDEPTGHATQCWIDRCDELTAFEIPAGKLWIGFDSYLHLEVKEPVEFTG